MISALRLPMDLGVENTGKVKTHRNLAMRWGVEEEAVAPDQGTISLRCELTSLLVKRIPDTESNGIPLQ